VKEKIESNDLKDCSVSIYRLLSILYVDKFLILFVFILFVFAGSYYAFSSDVKYNYMTTIEVGKKIVKHGDVTEEMLIEEPGPLLAKTNASYLPSSLSNIDPEIARNLKFEINNPKKSNLLTISSRSNEKVSEFNIEVHKMIIEKVTGDHMELLEVTRKRYANLLNLEKLKLQEIEDPRIYVLEEKELLVNIESEKMEAVKLKEQIDLLHSKGKRLEETQVLLKGEIAKLESILEQTTANRSDAISEVSDETQAMTLLMITNQIERNEERVSRLRERLSVTLEDEKEVLKAEVSDNRRKWDLQKEKIVKLQSELTRLRARREAERDKQKNTIASIEDDLSALRETRALGVAIKSLRPVGPGKTFLLALSGVLGLLSGTLLSLCRAYVRSERANVN